MGLTDWFNDVTDTLTSDAKAALETTRRLAEEAERELDRGLHEAEQIVHNVTAKVRNTADEMKRDLEATVPSFDGKLQEIIDDIKESASSAADEGVDITDSINGAVELVFQQIEKALQAAIDAVNRFLHEASDRFFRLLDGILPGFLSRLLSPVKSLIDSILKNLDFLAGKLKDGVSAAVQTIKSTVQAITRKIGEVLGPIWDYVKKLWKLFFDTEPEQCSLTAQWFDERMRRTEKQLLNKSSEQPVNTLIRKRTFLELLPPDKNSWRALVREFLNRADTSPAWATYGARLGPVLQSTSPRDGSLVQLTVDEPCMDRLGGHQRIQISILYYRWRTENFRKVSSGFLGILAMISAVGKQKKKYDTLPTQTVREQPLQIDAAAAREIYKIIEPHLWLRKLGNDQNLIFAQDRKARISLQMKRRDDDGIWRDTGKA
ncbi:hypothetical protein MMC28_005629 [Mycoblastus sanguinarius]|nr:hypothetical protein [Mycoblastus sanguinarius]